MRHDVKGHRMRERVDVTPELTHAVAAAVAAFGRRTQRFPVYVEPPDGAEVVSATELLQPDTLRRFFVRALSTWVVEPDSVQLLAAAASRFMRRYCGSLASAALIPLADGVAVDVSIPRVSFVVREDLPQGLVLDLVEDDLAVSPARPTRWPINAGIRLDTVAELRERALRSLFADNIVPAFDRVHEASHISRAMMWTTMAEQIDALYESAVEPPDGIAREVLNDDRDMLTSAEVLPGVDFGNPLRTALTWDRPERQRRFCCVCYVIPDRYGPGLDGHCPTCPRMTDAA